MLEREEYVEQAHFFRVIAERLQENLPLQDLLAQVREELLATTKLPLAVSYLLDELKHSGVVHPAMARMPHYFTGFQTYLLREAENDRSRFDYRTALEVLRFEAQYRAEGARAQGLFLYQFETLCRNRLGYDHGLAAIATDPIYDKLWREWIMSVRRRLGTIDIADLIFVRSEYYVTLRERNPDAREEESLPVLFGDKEGRIALANRRKDPLYLFAALQRQLGYPAVPRRKIVEDSRYQVPALVRRIEQFESRLKLLEDDQRGGFDLTKFYARPDQPPQDVG